MKKLLLTLFSILLAECLFAQQIRTNYRSEGMTHISTDYETIQLDSQTAQVRVELAGFPDGSTLYLLYVNLLQKTATAVPKGVKMAVTLSNGKLVRLEQIGLSSATPRRQEDGLFLNRLKYAAESADMEKMVKGIKSIDIITGWNPDDYIQASFPHDDLAALLKRHCETILQASESTIELKATLSGYTENLNSILSTAEPMVAKGERFYYNVLLSHLYYKDNNSEDLDLAFVIGTQEQYHIPYDASIRFTLGDGSVVNLLQARDDVNFVYVYPTVEELTRMVTLGITTLTINYENGVLEDTFQTEEGHLNFDQAVQQELQLLFSLSPR